MFQQAEGAPRVIVGCLTHALCSVYVRDIVRFLFINRHTLLMLSLQLLFWCLWRYSVHHAGRVFMGSQSVGSICFGTYFNFLVTRELT